jgi:putative membrane protein
MRILTPLAAMLGLGLLIALTAYYGFAGVGRAVASTGWGGALVVLARAAGLTGSGIGWGLLVPGLVVRRPRLFIGVRFIREAINSLFPVAGVGGDLIGARLLTFFGIAGGLAFASVFIDIFVQVATLLIFVLAGAGILLAVSNDHALISAVSCGLVVAVPAVAGFFVVLRVGTSNVIVARLTKVVQRRDWAGLHHVANLTDSLALVWRARRGFWASVALHLSLWFFGATEVWVALWFMGHPVGFAEAVAVESIGQAIRAAAFAMPAGLGVQDGGLIAVCGVFGVPAEVALGVALVKRIAELVLGVPGLLAWQAMEGRRLMAHGR